MTFSSLSIDIIYLLPYKIIKIKHFSTLYIYYALHKSTKFHVHIEYVNFVKRNIASFLTGTLFDTVVKIMCATAHFKVQKFEVRLLFQVVFTYYADKKSCLYQKLCVLLIESSVYDITITQNYLFYRQMCYIPYNWNYYTVINGHTR